MNRMLIESDMRGARTAHQQGKLGAFSFFRSLSALLYRDPPRSRYAKRVGAASLVVLGLLFAPWLHAALTNPGFETGAAGAVPTGWTRQAYLNSNGIAVYPPQKFGDLGLTPGGAANTVIVSANGAGPGTQTDMALATNAAFRWPLFGQQSAVVNGPNAAATSGNPNTAGTNKNTNVLTQTETIDTTDVDPVDGRVHIRFSVAPVLEDTPHSAVQQPYTFVEVNNLSKGTQLFHAFYSSQSSDFWQSQKVNGNTIKYTGWQAIDVSPGSPAIDIGDMVQVTLVAAGCAPGAHWAELYVDSSVQASSPNGALFVAASAPQKVGAPGTITYTYTYGNRSGATASGVIIDITPPAPLTFQSITPPPGATCTTPAVGSAGTIACTFTNPLTDQASGTIQAVFNVPANTLSPLVFDTYDIYGNVVAGSSVRNLQKVLGPAVTTAVQPMPTTALTSSVNPSVFGQPVTFTATVTAAAPASGMPTGTVTFLDGNNPIGTGTLSAGVATFTTSALAAGTHTITVSYGGDGTFYGGTGSLTGNPQGVSRADTATATTSLTNPSTYGQPVTFTATVTATAPSSGTPAGTVTFLDGSNPIGTATLSAGAATFTFSALNSGSHTITTRYNGDGNFNAGTGSLTGGAQAVNQATLTITADNKSRAYGAADPSFTYTPSGFVNGDTASVLSGSPTLTSTDTSTSPVGTSYAITVGQGALAAANYTFAFVPGTLSIVGQAAQTIAFTSTVPANATVGGTYTLAAASGGSTRPVTFSIDTISTPGACTLSGNVVAFAGAGACVIDANQAGDNNYTAAPQVQQLVTVGKAGSTAALAVSSTAAPANPSVFGQSVTFTATIVTANANAGGTVNFTDGGNVLSGCSGVALGKGSSAGGTTTFTAQCQTSSLAVAAHAIAAAYAGDTNTTASTSSTLTQVVSKAATTMMLNPPTAPIALGQSVSIGASVAVSAPGTGSPTGTITISDGGTGAGDTCAITVTASASGGTCSLTPSSAGAKALAATFAPDANSNNSLSGSNAPSATLTVNPAAAGMTLSSSANPSVHGQSVTFTATVVPASGGQLPTGSVSFTDTTTNTPLCASVALVAGATGSSATCATSGLATGNHGIRADYAGDANTKASTAMLASGQTVNAAETTTTIGSLPAITLGQAVTVAVSVAVQTPGTGTPAGTVSVSDGSASCSATLNSSGAGSCTLTPAAPAGSHRLTATYAATTDYASSTGSATLTVSAASVGTTLTSSANPSALGRSLTLTATVASASGNPAPTGTVSFTDGGAAIADCTNIPLSGGQAICTTSALAIGTHTLQANYGGDANNQASSGTLTQVISAPTTSMTLAASPNPAIYRQSVTLTATVTNGASTTGFGRSAQSRAQLPAASAVFAAAAPTGAVAFYDGSTSLGTGNLDANGVVTLTIDSLTPGAHDLNATYAGSSDYASATAQAVVMINAEPAPAPMLSWWVLVSLAAMFAYVGIGSVRRLAMPRRRH